MQGQIRGSQIQPEAIAKNNLAVDLQSELDAKALDSAVLKKDGSVVATQPMRGVAGVDATDFVVKSQLDGIAGGTQIKAQVLSSLAAQPAHLEGARHRATATAGNWVINHLYTSTGGVWVSDGAPASGWLVYDIAANDWLYFTGVFWSPNFQGFQVVFAGNGLSEDVGKNFNVLVDGTTIQITGGILEIIPNTVSPYESRAEVTLTPHTAVESYVLVNPLADGSFTINLPAGATHATGKVTVKDKRGMCSNHPTTIQAFAGETIDGQASIQIDNDRAALSMVFFGTEWSVI